MGPANLKTGVFMHMVRVSSKEPLKTITIRTKTIGSKDTWIDSELPCANTLRKPGHVILKIVAALRISEAN